MTEYLTAMDVEAMNEALLGQLKQSSFVRDKGALESAMARPRMAEHYEAADIVSQAVYLMSGISLAHAFLDGNKRTALIAGLTFLDMNGYGVTADHVELAGQIEAIVNRGDALEDAAARFEAWLRPYVKRET